MVTGDEAWVGINGLTQEIFDKVNRDISLTYRDISATGDPHEITSQLRASFSDIMLEDGETLSFVPSSEYMPDLGQYAWDKNVSAVTLRAWRWDYSDREQGRQLDIALWYPENCAQTISVSLHRMLGSLEKKDKGYEFVPGPATYSGHLSRDVTAIAYAEMGYDGHSQKSRGDSTYDDFVSYTMLFQSLMEG